MWNWRPQGYRNRKLTPEQVREIRALKMRPREIYAVCIRYGVSRTTIYRIRKREIYKDVL